MEQAKAECRRRSEGVQKSRIFPAGGGVPDFVRLLKKYAESPFFAFTLLARATRDFRRNSFLDDLRELDAVVSMPS